MGIAFASPAPFRLVLRTTLDQSCADIRNLPYIQCVDSGLAPDCAGGSGVLLSGTVGRSLDSSFFHRFEVVICPSGTGIFFPHNRVTLFV